MAYKNYGLTAMDKILARKSPVKKMPPIPGQEEDRLNLKPVPLDPGMANLSLPPEMPKPKPLSLAPQAPAALGAAQQPLGAGALGAAPQLATMQKEQQAAPPPPPPAPAPDPRSSGSPTEGMGSPEAQAAAAQAGGGSGGAFGDIANDVASEASAASTRAKNTDPDAGLSEYEIALRKLAEDAAAGKDIEKWQKSETQRAAEDLARKQDEQKARMGGVDNPYAALTGIQAQGEFLNRQGDINAKEVEMWLQGQQNAANIYGRLEANFQQKKPDVYAEFKPKLEGAFGVGYKVNPDGSVILGDGTTKSYGELSQPEKSLVSDYQHAMGWDAASEVSGAAAEEEAKLEIADMLATIDSDYGANPSTVPTSLKNAIYDLAKRKGRWPTMKELADMYSRYGIDWAVDNNVTSQNEWGLMGDKESYAKIFGKEEVAP